MNVTSISTYFGELEKVKISGGAFIANLRKESCPEVLFQFSNK